MARRDDAGFVGEHDGLNSVSEMEFHEDVGDVGPDGAEADQAFR
jgi:hypothetical protein